MKNACERCLMPFNQDPGVREDERYCSYCFSGGELHAKDMNLTAFKKMCYEKMRERGIGPIKARFFTFMIGFAPHWKHKK